MKRYKYHISKSFEFSAAHHLPNVPQGHPCGRNHGHNYIVTVEIGANRLNPYGFVIDYRDLDVVKNRLDELFDHYDLNDTVVNPTAELLASYIYSMTQPIVKGLAAGTQLISVAVKETNKTSAVYYPNLEEFEETGSYRRAHVQ